MINKRKIGNDSIQSGLIQGLSRHLSGETEESRAKPLSGYEFRVIHLCQPTRRCVMASHPIYFAWLFSESRQTGCLNGPRNWRSMNRGTPGLMASSSLTEGKTELLSH